MEVTTKGLLSNSLILKYWGHLAPYERAYAILISMQEPIKKGEYLMLIDQWGGSHTPGEPGMHFRCDQSIADKPIVDVIHTSILRLPDAFQPKAEKCGCACHKVSWGHPDDAGSCCQKPDPVEEKIKEIASFWFKNDTVEGFASRLRELVALARGSK